MAFAYAPLAATARRLIDSFGQPVTLTRRTAGTFDPVTGAVTGAADETQAAVAVLLDFTAAESGQAMTEGTQVRQGDKKMLIAAEGLIWAPDELTKVTDAAGTVWGISNMKTLSPAGTPLVYTARAFR